jgi:hypothetical protein
VYVENRSIKKSPTCLHEVQCNRGKERQRAITSRCSFYDSEQRYGSYQKRQYYQKAPEEGTLELTFKGRIELHESQQKL